MPDDDVTTLEGSAGIGPDDAIDNFLAESGTPTRSTATARPPANPQQPVPGMLPPSRRDRREAGRLRARKVRRIVRHVEPWSVLKMSLILYFCMWVIIVIAGVALWSLAVNSGTIDNFESFLSEVLALESFEFDGGDIFEAAAIGGLILVIALTGFSVLVAVLFNLISDLTGGVRVTVVEEETARYMSRRPGRQQPAPAPTQQRRPARSAQGAPPQRQQRPTGQQRPARPPTE